MESPFEVFLKQALKDFEQHLKAENLREGPIDQRMRGAREFTSFLLGQPHRKHERLKGRL
jgi:hypothetical protein